MKTRIISAFPGTGKTTFYNKNKDVCLDSDSSNFSWVTEDGKKIRNPEFPKNYINHIKENIGKYKFILVSSHKEVRDALKNDCLFFYLIYPRERDKEKFLERYVNRGSDDSFVKLLSNNWNSWIKGCGFETVGCENIPMVLDNLSDEIGHIVASENGEN